MMFFDSLCTKQHGDTAKAVEFFEKNYEIARATGDRTLIDAARINLGMSKGKVDLSKYMSVRVLASQSV
jgi:hypothetical protein